MRVKKDYHSQPPAKNRTESFLRISQGSHDSQFQLALGCGMTWNPEASETWKENQSVSLVVLSGAHTFPLPPPLSMAVP